MTKKLVWDEESIENDQNWYCYYHGLRVEENGAIISSIIEKIEMESDWTYVTVDVEGSRSFSLQDIFLIVHNDGLMSDTNGLFVVFYDDFVGEVQKEWAKVAIKKVMCSFQGAVCIQLEDGGDRWLFPHPKGTRAAYEHMKNTTLEDDWHTLQQQHDISNNPDVLATFSFL